MFRSQCGVVNSTTHSATALLRFTGTLKDTPATELTLEMTFVGSSTPADDGTWRIVDGAARPLVYWAAMPLFLVCVPTPEVQVPRAQVRM